MSSCLCQTAELCVDIAKSFLPGTMETEERIIAGCLGAAGAITGVALAVLSAPPVALAIVGGISAAILVGAVLGSRGITYSALITAGAFFVAGAALGHIPVALAIVI